MATYIETVNYFEDLCVQSLQVAHSATKKKFFRMNMEEFLSGSLKDLPNHSEGPFCVLIGYIGEYETPKHHMVDTKQIMFYILHGYKQKDYTEENTARSAAEETLEDFLLRMREDSRSGHAFFGSAFDQIQRVRRIPAEIRTMNGSYVGWQCSMFLTNPVNKCYDPNKWAAV